MEKIAIVLGSNMFIGTNGILTVEIGGKMVEFFKIKETFRELSPGSYLTIDCDIKDKDNDREVKLFKSKPVVNPHKFDVVYNHRLTHVTREDGSTVIKIEQIDINDLTLPQAGPVYERLKKEKLDPIIRITGDFYAGPFKLVIDNKFLKVGGVTMSGNLSERTGGLKLSSMGFSF